MSKTDQSMVSAKRIQGMSPVQDLIKVGTEQIVLVAGV
jgi:hypothetical protein